MDSLSIDRRDISQRNELVSTKNLLKFGPIATLVFWLGVSACALSLPDYQSVHQTVSEIGEVGSPMRAPFTATLLTTAFSLMLFALGLKRVASERGHSSAGALFVAAMGLSAAGAGVFAYPHPLHNVFGMSELIGFQAPAFLAFTWRKDAQRSIVQFSWIMYGLVTLADIANLSVLSPHGFLWTYERPFYGIVQRALFATWFVWCGGVGILMRRTTRDTLQRA